MNQSRATSVTDLPGHRRPEPIRERHARYYLGVALREAAAATAGPEQPHLEMLRDIEDNTRIALECLLSIDAQAALQLAVSLNFLRALAFPRQTGQPSRSFLIGPRLFELRR